MRSQSISCFIKQNDTSKIETDTEFEKELASMPNHPHIRDHNQIQFRPEIPHQFSSETHDLTFKQLTCDK